MSLPERIHCWEVIECGEASDCKARQFPDVPCWEIDQMRENGQIFSDVCRECKVYILNTEELFLTENEFQDIIQHRQIMKFVQKCPAYSNRLRNEDGLPV